MSAKTDNDYLRDMIKYAEDAQTLVASRSLADLEHDEQFRYALQYCLLIVGEAASHVSENTRQHIPNLPWKQIVGMRNWLVHGYFVLHAETIWNTATRDIPILIEEILNYLPPEQT